MVKVPEAVTLLERAQRGAQILPDAELDGAAWSEGLAQWLSDVEQTTGGFSPVFHRDNPISRNHRMDLAATAAG